MKRLLICALISLFGVVACQELYDEPINNDLSTAPLNNEIWYRTIDNSALSLSGSHFNSTIDDVLFDGEYFRVKFAGTVTTIKEGAFNEYPQLEMVYLPASIRSVEKLAFYGCENLKQFKGDVASDDGRVIIIDGELCAYAPKYMHSYTIPNQVLSIGEYAFYGCNELTEVIISDGVNEIKNCAFERCSNLRKVEFSRVDVIGERAFAKCSFLEELDLPETLNKIGDSAFMDCDNLRRVDVPSSVEIIRTQTFMGCDALTEIILNDGLYSIEAKAFMDCYQLERVTIPASVGSVGQYLFSNCGNLKEVYCKAQTPPVLSSGSVDSWSAFDGCSSELRIYVPFESLSEYREAYGWSMYSSELVGYDFERGEVVPDGDDNHKIFYTATECVIPIYQSAFDAEYQTSYWNSKTGEGYLLFDRPVTEIGDSAFADCIALKSVTIPESVNIVGESAFRNCRALESFSGKFATYDGYALVVDNTFVAYAIGAAVKSYAIPEGVTTVESYAFFKGSKLEDVTIPSSVEQIEGDAFNECTSLKAVYCLPTTPPAALYGDNSWGAFDFNNANRIIYVPTDSLEEYVVADGWADYASQIVAFSSAEFEKLTVAEFLAKEDGETYYELTGEITDVVSTYYGNFDLTDSTGTVYIYGLYSPDGESYYWGESGVAEGDTITIHVQRSSYNGTAQGGKARYVSHVKGEEKVVVDVDITSFEYSEYDYTTDAYKYHLSCDSCSLDLYVDSSFVESDAYQIMAGAYTWVPINLFGGYNSAASFTTDNISVVGISNSVESGSMLVMGRGDIEIELVMDDSATLQIHCDATLFGGEPTHIATKWLWSGLSNYGNKYVVSGDGFTIDVHFPTSVTTESSLATGEYAWKSTMWFSNSDATNFTTRSFTLGGSDDIVPISDGSAKVTASGDVYTIQLTLVHRETGYKYMIEYVGKLNDAGEAAPDDVVMNVVGVSASMRTGGKIWDLILIEKDYTMGEPVTQITVEMGSANMKYITSGTYSTLNSNGILPGTVNTDSGEWSNSVYRYNTIIKEAIEDCELTIAVDEATQTAAISGYLVSKQIDDETGRTVDVNVLFEWNGHVEGFRWEDPTDEITDWNSFAITSSFDDCKVIRGESMGGNEVAIYLHMLGATKADALAAGTYPVADWVYETTANYCENVSTKVNGFAITSGSVTVEGGDNNYTVRFELSDGSNTYKGVYTGALY